MNKILLPIDFTEVSFNAFQFAMKMYPDSELHLVHVHSGVANITNPVALESGMDLDDSIAEEIQAIILERNIFSDNRIPDNIKIKVLPGDVVQEVVNFAEKESFDLTIIGTRDKYDLLDRWFGTNSLGLVKRLKMPVYLIPRYSTYKPFEKVLVASDAHLTNTDRITDLKIWNNKFNAFLKFVHVRSDNEDEVSQETPTIIKELFEKDNPEFGFEIVSIKSNSISESILASAYKFQADLLIVFTEQQSFIRTLLFKSLSKKLIIKSSIPILFFHA